MTANVRYEIAPIYNLEFLNADPIMRRHIVNIGVLEYEKAVMETVEMENLERKTKDILSRIQRNRAALVEEWDQMMKQIKMSVIHNGCEDIPSA